MQDIHPKSIACDRDLLPGLQENSTSFQMLSLEMSGSFHSSPTLEKATVPTLHISLRPFFQGIRTSCRGSSLTVTASPRRLKEGWWVEKRGVEMSDAEMRKPKHEEAQCLLWKSPWGKTHTFLWMAKRGFRSLGDVNLTLAPNTTLCFTNLIYKIEERGVLWITNCATLGSYATSLCRSNFICEWSHSS